MSERRIGDAVRGRMTIDVECDNHVDPIPPLRSFSMLAVERDSGGGVVVWTAPTVMLMGDRRVVDGAGKILDDLDKGDRRTLGGHSSITFKCSCGRPPLTVRTDRLEAILAQLADCGQATISVAGLRSVLARPK